MRGEKLEKWRQREKEVRVRKMEKWRQREKEVRDKNRERETTHGEHSSGHVGVLGLHEELHPERETRCVGSLGRRVSFVLAPLLSHQCYQLDIACSRLQVPTHTQ